MTTPAIEPSFKQFVFRHKIILCLSAAAIIIQFVLFKYFYPYASGVYGESLSYVEAAEKNLSVNTYPIGYSKFLQWVHFFYHGDYLLTAIQYLCIQCSALYLLFTIGYFYKPGKWLHYLLLAVMVFNPLFLHLANLVSSDAMFTAASLTWFSLLLWIVHRPSTKIIIWHAVILLVAFTLRYSALLYPFISALAFALSTLPLRKKITGFGLAVLVCGLFVGFTMSQYKQLTGYWQYSPLSGWQLANNALFAYSGVDSADRKPVPVQFQLLDNISWDFLDRMRYINFAPGEVNLSGTMYMWVSSLPLITYRDSLFKATDPPDNELKKWATLGPFYKNYGLHLIKKYPLQFLVHYITPNARKYYSLPVEYLGSYNSGRIYVYPLIKRWFGYKGEFVKTRMKELDTSTLNFYPVLSGISNVMLLFGLLYYVLLKGWRYNPVFNKTLIMAGAIWLLDAVFKICTSPPALRTQAFPMVLTIIFALLLVGWMVQLIKYMKQHQHPPLPIAEPLSKEVIA